MNLNLKHLMVRAGGFRQNTVLRRDDKTKNVIKKKKTRLSQVSVISKAKESCGKDGDQRSEFGMKQCRFELKKYEKRSKN